MVPSSQAVSFGFGNYANYGHGITVPGAGNLLTGTTVLRAPTFSFQPSPPFAQQHGKENLRKFDMKRATYFICISK